MGARGPCNWHLPSSSAPRAGSMTASLLATNRTQGQHILSARSRFRSPRALEHFDGAASPLLGRRRFVRYGGWRGRGQRSGWRQIADGGALDRRAGVREDVEVGDEGVQAGVDGDIEERVTPGRIER